MWDGKKGPVAQTEVGSDICWRFGMATRHRATEGDRLRVLREEMLGTLYMLIFIR